MQKKKFTLFKGLQSSFSIFYFYYSASSSDSLFSSPVPDFNPIFHALIHDFLLNVDFVAPHQLARCSPYFDWSLVKSYVANNKTAFISHWCSSQQCVKKLGKQPLVEILSWPTSIWSCILARGQPLRKPKERKYIKCDQLEVFWSASSIFKCADGTRAQ
jgi:hypothetical protein